MSKLFRKSALDRLSSPEQLDQIMRVTSPMNWAVLAACATLIVLAVVWGVFGTIPTKVAGQGILVEKGAVFDVVTVGEGQVLKVYVDENERVEEGQVVARISQPDIQHQLDEAKRALRHLRDEKTVTEQLGTDIHSSRNQHIAQQRRSISDSIRLSQSRLKDLRERLAQYEDLLKKGLVDRKTLLDAKAEYIQAQQEVLRFQEQLASLPATSYQATSERKKEQIDVEFRIIHAEEEVETYKDRLAMASRVVSPTSGRVNEIFKTDGEYLKPGEAIMSLETYSPEDEFYVSAYFPPDQGKRIAVGMTMQVAPSVAKREEYGVLLAEVVGVSSFPATPRGMLHVLGNEKLVEVLAEKGPPIAVRAKLIKDPATFSGFRWSSGQGAPIQLQSGTMCQADVVVEEQHPISLVIPYLRKSLLGIGETR